MVSDVPKIAAKGLIIDKSIYERSNLNDDAIERYYEMYANRKTKTITIQAVANKI